MLLVSVRDFCGRTSGMGSSLERCVDPVKVSSKLASSDKANRCFFAQRSNEESSFKVESYSKKWT